MIENLEKKMTELKPRMLQKLKNETEIDFDTIYTNRDLGDLSALLKGYREWIKFTEDNFKEDKALLGDLPDLYFLKDRNEFLIKFTEIVRQTAVGGNDLSVNGLINKIAKSIMLIQIEVSIINRLIDTSTNTL